MKCSWITIAVGKCNEHATQVVLAICAESHIRERVFCDIHASDWRSKVREESRVCPKCGTPYLESEIREIHPGFAL